MYLFKPHSTKFIHIRVGSQIVSMLLILLIEFIILTIYKSTNNNYFICNVSFYRMFESKSEDYLKWSYTRKKREIKKRKEMLMYFSIGHNGSMSAC